MEYYNNFIDRAINLFEKLTGEKPDTILMGTTDFKLYNNSLEYEKQIQGVPIEAEDTEPEGIFIHSRSETYPYAVMVEAYIAEEMLGSYTPNVMRISMDFYEIFDYAFTTDEPSYNPVFNCIIEIIDDLWEDVICGYSEEYEEAIKKYKKITGKSKTNATINKSPKDKFIDWLINDDEAQLEAMQYIEDHEEEIDEDFILFQRECEFKRYLKDNGYDNYEEEDL